MGDEGEALEIEGLDERGDVVGECVEVVAAGRLIGAAVAAAIEADAAESLVREGRHLVVPHPARAAEAAQEQDRRARSPLMPIELRAVFRCDEGHGIYPRCEGWWKEARPRSRRRERMVDQDPPVVVDDQEFEPAREHGLAVGEQHFPAERHNVAAQTRAGGGAKANAFSPAVLCGGYEGEL